MLLTTGVGIKAIVLACVILAMILQFHKKMEKEWLAAVAVLTIVFAVLANIISNPLGHLKVYIFTLLLFVTCASLLIRLVLKDSGGLEQYLAKYGYRFLYAFIALLCFTVMVRYSGYIDFWYDDLCQLGYITYPHSFTGVLAAETMTPPLSRVIDLFWYSVAPYGKACLLLPCELAVAGAVYLTGLCGKRMKNTLTGAVAAILVGLNISTITSCAYVIRPYPFYLFFTVLSLYLYIRRWQLKDYSWRFGLLLGAVMMLNGYTHYFGIFLSGAMFLCDCYLIIRKKANLRYLVPYALAIILYIPWIVFYFVTALPKSLTWPVVPNWKAVETLLFALNGNLHAIEYLFILGAVVSVTRVVFDIFKKNEERNFYIEIIPLLLSVILIGGLYLYATQIAWRSTFWVDRYFYGLIPCFMLVCAIGVDAICGVFRQMNHPSSKMISTVICVCLAILVVPQMVNSLIYEESQEYETPTKIADWLYSKPDIMNSNTLILCTDSAVQSGYTNFEAAQEGWIEYYLKRRGKRETPNVVNIHDISEKEILQHNVIYVYRMHNNTVPNDFDSTINKYYNLAEMGVKNSFGDVRGYAYVKKPALSKEEQAEAGELKSANILQYLSLLTNKDYIVFMAVCDNAGAEVSNEVRDALKRFGLMDMNEANGASYLAVLDSGIKVHEEISTTKALSYEISINGTPVQLESAGWAMGIHAAVKVGGINYLLQNQRGLGILVYDKKSKAVLDAVTWDIYHGLNGSYR